MDKKLLKSTPKQTLLEYNVDETCSHSCTSDAVRSHCLFGEISEDDENDEGEVSEDDGCGGGMINIKGRIGKWGTFQLKLKQANTRNNKESDSFPCGINFGIDFAVKPTNHIQSFGYI